MIRTRIAPSPTGLLHIGTARTALFNYLYAKNQGGQFVLRVEDTDKARSTAEFEDHIVAGLEWLGLQADEGITSEGSKGDLGPYRQSERTSTYRPYLEQLAASGDAYWDNTPSKEITNLQAAAQESKQAFVYRPECRDGSQEYQEGSVLRFRVPDEVIWFDDKIKGKIEFNVSLLSDFTISKGWDNPLYNFVVVIDDELMNITHIIRGEDHISNTPKQILVNKALGFTRKNFGHMPLILATDRSKMSKRHGAVSIDQYRQDGYLPEAMINYLALLGWNEGNDREIYTMEEVIKKFSLKRVQKSGAVFNIEKLQSVNAHYIKELSLDQKVTYGIEFLQKNGYDTSILTESQLQATIELECQRIKIFGEIGEGVDFVFAEPSYDKDILLWKDMTSTDVLANLEWVREVVYNIEEKTSKEIEQIIKSKIQEDNRKPGYVLWPLRVALSGKERSPSPFEILAILNKSQSLTRIDTALKILS